MQVWCNMISWIIFIILSRLWAKNIIEGSHDNFHLYSNPVFLKYFMKSFFFVHWGCLVCGKSIRNLNFNWLRSKENCVSYGNLKGNEINLFTMFKCTYLGNADSSLLSRDKINYLNIHIHILRKLHHSFSRKLSYKRDIWVLAKYKLKIYNFHLWNTFISYSTKRKLLQ